MKYFTRLFPILFLFAVVTWLPAQGIITGAGAYTETTIGAGDDCSLRSGNDYTYNFTPAVSGSWTFSICSSAPAWDSYVYLMEGTGCGTATITESDDYCNTLSEVAATLTAGIAYSLVIEGFNSIHEGDFVVEVSSPVSPPVNDNCSGAIDLTPVAGEFTDPGIQTSAGGTSSGVTIPVCSSVESSEALDVWYNFTTIENGDITFIVTPVSFLDVIVEVMSDACGTTTSLGCIDNGLGGEPETLAITGLDANTTYFLRIYGWDGGTGAFNIEMSGTALPIELKSFTGKSLAVSNMLYWTTAAEKNVTSHIIERSASGSTWTEIGQKNGSGTSRLEQKYEMEDKSPLPKAFYRIRTVDDNGQEHLSPMISINRDDHDLRITAAFPNPAGDLLNIQFYTPEEETVTMQITDLTGRLVFRQQMEAAKGTNLFPAILDQLCAGAYMINIVNSNTVAAPVRFVKK